METTLHHPKLEWFSNTKKPYRMEWIALCALLMVVYISYTYNDIVATTRHGIMLWDCVFQGKFFDFYAFTNNAVTGNSVFVVPQGAAYDFTIYLIFGLWNFPLWVVEKLFAVSATENVFCLLWSKLMLLVLLALAAKVLYDIAIELKMSHNTASWVVFVWLSSELLCASTLLMSQYDILGLLFILYGFLSYLRNDTKKFVIFFAVATSCKYFAILIFIPLLLLRQKKVWRLLVNVCLVFSVSFFWKCVFSLSKSNVGKADLVSGGLPAFFSTQVGSGLFNGSIFVMVMIALCIYCYAQPEDHQPNARNAVFVAAAAMFAFIITVRISPYWAVLGTPFFVLLSFSNANHFKLNIYLETAFSLSVLVQQWVVFSWCFSNRIVMPMIWGNIFGKASNEFTGIADIIASIEAAGLPVTTIAASIMLCCAAALLVFNRPAKQTLGAHEEIHIERSVIWMRCILLAGTMMLPLAYYFVYIICND